jgi:hypothetical protein
MSVVISDLHFEEEALDVIHGRGGRPDVIFRRNLNPRAYRNFIAKMAEQVLKRKVKEFQLVIAGDLFDFSRTTLWFADELRPYVSLSKVDEKLERKTLRILDATANEASVKNALEVFQWLARVAIEAPRVTAKNVTSRWTRSKFTTFPEIMIASAMRAGNSHTSARITGAEWMR